MELNHVTFDEAEFVVRMQITGVEEMTIVFCGKTYEDCEEYFKNTYEFLDGRPRITDLLIEGRYFSYNHLELDGSNSKVVMEIVSKDRVIY